MTGTRRRAVLLGLQTAALLVLLLVAVAVLTFTTYERVEHRDARRQLERLSGSVAASDVADVTAGVWAVVVGPGGRTSSGPAPAGLPVEADVAAVRDDGDARQREVEVASVVWFVRTSARGDAVVQVALDRTAAEDASGRVLRALLLSGAVGIVCAAALSVHLARRAMAPLEEALEKQRRFVADAGHELRTPLTLLSTRAQLVARRLRRAGGPPVGEEVQRDLDGLRADAAALAEVLEELLVAADPRTSAEREPCDLSGLVRECADAVRAKADARGVAVTVAGTVPSGTGATVPASPPAVRRAVLSLLDNAVDHAATRVSVEVRPQRRHVDLVVADDGPGVPEEERSRVFERFASGRATAASSTSSISSISSSGPRHHGLGLSLVAEVAAAHGGSVAVGPRADGAPGAEFELALPR